MFFYLKEALFIIVFQQNNNKKIQTQRLSVDL